MTKDKIADKPRPAGARPYYFTLALDCRDGALIRDEALYRGVTEKDIEREFLKGWIRDIRSRAE